jgi:PAS domain-containing protein
VEETGSLVYCDLAMSVDEALGARELVLSTLLGDGADNVQLGIFVYDDQGSYVAANHHAAELLGYSREELLARHVGDFTEAGVDPAALLRAERREDWNIPDPKGLPPEQFRAVRDLIGEKVRDLLARL